MLRELGPCGGLSRFGATVRSAPPFSLPVAAVGAFSLLVSGTAMAQSFAGSRSGLEVNAATQRLTLNTLDFGGKNPITSSSYVFPVGKTEVLEGSVDGSFVPNSDPALHDALKGGSQAWPAIDKWVHLSGAAPTKIQLFLGSSQPDLAEEEDRDPELIVMGEFPVGTNFRAMCGGADQSPIQCKNSFTITADMLAQGRGSVEDPLSVSPATDFVALGLDGSRDLGIPTGAFITGYEITLPPGSSTRIQLIPVCASGDPDAALGGQLGIDKASVSRLKVLFPDQYDDGEMEGTLPIPSAISMTYGNAPAINPDGGQAGNEYTIVTNPDLPIDGEDFEPDGDDPTGGDPSDPTDPNDPGDPDDPDGPGDPNDPDDPDGKDPGHRNPPDNGVIVVRPQVPTDPLDDSVVPNSTDGDAAPSVPAPGALVLLGLGGSMMARGRRRR